MNVIEIIDKLKVNADESLDQLLLKMDNGKEGILLVVDNNDCLIGIITDGDIRREIISSGPNSSSSAKKIMSSNPIISKSDNSTYWQEIFNQNNLSPLKLAHSNSIESPPDFSSGSSKKIL